MDVPKIKQNYDALRAEYQICRRKLDSKCEALLILSKDLDQCRQERDQFKLMAEQVQERYQALKRQLAGVAPKKEQLESSLEFAGKSSQNLAHLLCEMREVNKSLQFDVDDLKQKLSDAQGDIKLLREQIARQRVGTSDEGLSLPRHFPAYEREELVKKLEISRDEFNQLERDLQQVLDEKEELVTERDVYKSKYERLNTELNYILKGDEKRIVDIDALTMDNKFDLTVEPVVTSTYIKRPPTSRSNFMLKLVAALNRYLKDRLKQMEEEKSAAIATLSKYKSILERKKNKGIQKLGQSRSGGVVITQKQVVQLLESQHLASPTPQMVTDLQSLAGALLETVHDKNLAISHQRKTNKILGTRVAELEKKLKTLEVSGLWSLPGNNTSSPHLDKLRMECEEIKMLVPQPSQSSDEAPSTTITPDVTPEHKPHKVPQNAGLSLEDLDLLPTKEEPDLGDGLVLSPRSETNVEDTGPTERRVRLLELHDGGGDGDREADDEGEEDEEEDAEEEADDGFLGALINDVAERVAACSQTKQETSNDSQHSPTCTSPLLSRKLTSAEESGTTELSENSKQLTPVTLNQDCATPLLGSCSVGDL